MRSIFRKSFHLLLIGLIFGSNARASENEERLDRVTCLMSHGTFQNVLLGIVIRHNGVIAGPKEKLGSCAEVLERVEESGCDIDPFGASDIESYRDMQIRNIKTQNMYGQAARYVKDLPACNELLRRAKSAEESAPH